MYRKIQWNVLPFGLYEIDIRILVRDRYGIKPLYYCRDSDYFIFASENKAIVTYNSRLKTLDYQALLEYFTFQNIFTNRTLFKNIQLLEAGHYLEIDLQSEKNI